MPKVKINDTELYYIEHGSGTPFLVMHGGLGVDHTYLRPTLDPLGDNFKLIFYDHRGHGRSGRPPTNTITYEQLADDANALRETLGYDKIGVIGNSAGGYIALHYAIRHQKNISYLILIDTAPAFDYMEELMAIVERKNPTPEIIATLDAPAAPTIEEFRHQFKVLQPLYFYDFNSEVKEISDEIIDKMILNPEAAALNEELMPKYNISSQLTEIEVPTLILVGDEDFICPPSQAKRMHNSIPNSELIIFKKCGHYPFFEARDEFFRVIHDWFKRVHHK
ncbi:MAG: alpha/beta hydrolase [Candidatus Lokiarchaeota archaeon]|nr:alpha/beta hydrolase [Candidatus Lokiarchaeota archaeon]